MDKLRVNGVCLEGENGMAGAFQLLLSDTGEWRPSIEELAFNSLSPADSAALEVSFSKEEVFFALSSMSRDKASCLDGFILAFWQDRLDVVKDEVLGFFLVISMSRGALREV